MNILVFGAGGVGSVVGGFLARMGHDVSLIGRSWHLDAVEKNGLRITGIWGDYHLKALECYRSLERIPSDRRSAFDLIFLTVKSYDTAAAAAELAPIVGPKTTLVSLQNGLGNIETILEKIPAERYLAGRIIFGAELEPGIAKVTVNADDVLIGAPTAAKTSRSVEVAHVLSSAKIPARATDRILTAIWAKVIYNCALNAICSIHEMPYGKILENPQTRVRMETVVRECYAVGLRKKVPLDPPGADAYLALLTDKLIPPTAAHFPSMLQDLRRGKRTDIDALNGAIARYGRELGVPTPENERLAESIRNFSVKIA